MKYLYTLEEDYSYQSVYRFENEYKFYDNKFNHWLTITKDGTITVNKNYSWDGCTPKIFLFGYWIGTPEGPIEQGKPQTYYASLIHDVLCQFYLRENFPLSMKSVDKIFLSLMIKYNFKYASLYYSIVRTYHTLIGKF